MVFACNEWHEHAQNSLNYASKVLGMMRKIKFTINRKALQQIYFSFLRPILEYGCMVWGGCTQYEKDNLERIQHEAARIVTGLTRSTSLRKLYVELGWLSLENRRLYQRLVIAYKVKQGVTPEFLNNLFPDTVGIVTPYNLRNNNNYSVINARTQLFRNSFIPSCISSWNSIPQHIRDSETLALFKRQINNHLFKTIIVPCYYLTGLRFLSVIHARLRNGCSNLNFDLFTNKLKLYATCEQCGHEKEDAEHYFMQCPTFLNDRLPLFHATRHLHPLNVETLLFGRDSLSDEENTSLFNNVQMYIKNTKRF